MGWIITNWQWCLLGFFIVEKVVKLTPFKWDDLLIDGIKAGYAKWKAGK